MQEFGMNFRVANLDQRSRALRARALSRQLQHVFFPQEKNVLLHVEQKLVSGLLSNNVYLVLVDMPAYQTVANIVL